MSDSHPALPDGDLIHRLARLLRHEVGDLLQSVYSTVAILQDRLPADRTLERRLAGDLKTRAEACKHELDAVVDLVSPLQLKLARIDLSAILTTALNDARRRYGSVQVHQQGSGPLFILTDPRCLTGALSLLCLALGQGAQQNLWVRLQQEDGNVVCALERDGFPATAEQLAWLTRPFASTQAATLGLGLAYLRRLVEAQGGNVVAADRRDGGLCVRFHYPVAPDA